MSDAVTQAPAAAALFTGLLDDAAIFPPGNASLADALRGWVHSRASSDAGCIGAFLCSSGRLAEMVHALPTDLDRLDLSLVLPGTSALEPVLAHVAAEDRLVLRAVELPSGDSRAQAVVEALDELLPDGVLGYVELPLGPEMGCTTPRATATR